MTRLPIVIAAVFSGVLLAPALVLADANSGGSGKFEYGPYHGGTTGYTSGQNGSQDQGSQDQTTEPAEQSSTAPAAPLRPDVADRPDNGPAPGTAVPWHNPDADANANPNSDDDDEDGPPPNGAAPPPPRATEGPPPGPPGDTFAGPTPRVEVSASAPDSSVPVDIRTHDARKAAIGAWRDKVAGRLGPEFAHWRAAADKRVDCHPEPAAGIVCIVSAQPVRGFARYGQGPHDHY